MNGAYKERPKWKGEDMPRYLMILDYQGGTDDTPGGMAGWKPEEVQGHMSYYEALNKALTESGELVHVEALTPPDQAFVVTSDGADRTVTDGPFQEFKEWVAGYMIIDAETQERALEIAGLYSAAPGPGGRPIEQPIQVRRMYHGTDGSSVDDTIAFGEASIE
ncbi:YciI family protein [Nocardioides sp. NPDC057772]|uniref:YciI family protein n=1 Tax=Nocardioides sp. NPDC057772 TaxID=3346245 RepID=UPI00366FBC38